MNVDKNISAGEFVKGLDDMADGVFIVDDNLRIQMWNKAAERILGYRSGDVEGRFCYEVLRGLNERGNLICSEHCKVLKKARASEPISSYDTEVRTSRGRKCWLNTSIFPLRFGEAGERFVIAHIFRDVSQKKGDEIIFSQILDKARRYQGIPVDTGNDNNGGELVEELTRRQREVLYLMASGFSTREIAENLYISQYTVRNHIQHIFQKFRVNNRLEAVAFALKNGLLDNINGGYGLKI